MKETYVQLGILLLQYPRAPSTPFPCESQEAQRKGFNKLQPGAANQKRMSAHCEVYHQGCAIFFMTHKLEGEVRNGVHASYSGPNRPYIMSTKVRMTLH